MAFRVIVCSNSMLLRFVWVGVSESFLLLLEVARSVRIMAPVGTQGTVLAHQKRSTGSSDCQCSISFSAINCNFLAKKSWILPCLPSNWNERGVVSTKLWGKCQCRLCEPGNFEIWGKQHTNKGSPLLATLTHSLKSV